MAPSEATGASKEKVNEVIVSTIVANTIESEPHTVLMMDDKLPSIAFVAATYTTPKKRTRPQPTKARKHAKTESSPSVVETEEPSVRNESVAGMAANDGVNIRRRIAHVVTPVGEDEESNPFNASVSEEKESPSRKPRARRALNMDEPQTVAPVTPSPIDSAPGRHDHRHGSGHTPKAKRKLIFGRQVSPIQVNANVENVYNIVKKHTGSLGGNAIGGAIYGELTMGSMQKMINLMKQHTNLNSNSIFIDVGSGIGKPNLHVAQDPGVQASIGIEMDADRYLLGMTCLKAVLDAAALEQQSEPEEKQPQTVPVEVIQTKCHFIHGNIMDAATMDPFTHVYMFSIGFPPKLWRHLATIFNLSSSPYLICYHSPKDIIHKYEFDVELIAQTPTSMHGSKEGHTGYIYQRTATSKATSSASVSSPPFDQLFKTSFDLIQADFTHLQESVDRELQTRLSSQSVTRSRAKSTRL